MYECMPVYICVCVCGCMYMYRSKLQCDDRRRRRRSERFSCSLLLFLSFLAFTNEYRERERETREARLWTDISLPMTRETWTRRKRDRESKVKVIVSQLELSRFLSVSMFRLPLVKLIGIFLLNLNDPYDIQRRVKRRKSNKPGNTMMEWTSVMCDRTVFYVSSQWIESTWNCLLTDRIFIFPILLLGRNSLNCQEPTGWRWRSEKRVIPENINVNKKKKGEDEE